MTRRSLVSTLSWFAAARSLGAQTPTFSAGVNVVNIYATVRDRKGQIVKSLTRDDFLLEEDGRPQQIRYFSQESNLPLTIGLLIDTSGSTRNVLPQERSASFQFLRQVMRQDKDAAFVIQFDFDATLLQDLTKSHRLLERALDEVAPAGLQRRPNGPWTYPGGRSGRGGMGRRNGGGGTVLYDAVFLAADELMRKQTGRKALIVLSDGLDNGSRYTLFQAEESAQRADALVYSILFEDPDMDPGMFGGRRRGPDGRDVLQQISRDTGGRFFEVQRRMPIDRVFVAIEEDLRNQYSLGYSPDAPDTQGRYRKIRLTTKQRGLIVNTREGYYAS
jgi:VWFA-related protein